MSSNVFTLWKGYNRKMVRIFDHKMRQNATQKLPLCTLRLIYRIKFLIGHVFERYLSPSTHPNLEAFVKKAQSYQRQKA